MTNPILQGIEEPEFKAWRHHPVTKLLLQYLADYRESLIKEAVGRWEAGQLILTDEHELRARVVTVKELIELQFTMIVEFYRSGDDVQSPAHSG